MDRAQFEFIGNVGKVEIKPLSEGKKIAVLSVATSERWKPDGGDWIEKTHWHRIAVFAAAKISLIETSVQKGTRLRLAGQIRPTSWEDASGVTRYAVEFVIGASGEVEIVETTKPKADPAGEPAAVKTGRSGKSAAGARNPAAA